MDLSNLEKVLENEPKYRLKQANEAVFKNFISDWSEATFFSKDLRDKLNKECPLEIEADVLISKKEDSVKARITLKDGFKIETVLMRHKDNRNTVCVSSQVGCPLGCLFCATGKMGFKRNLTSDEIIEQVIFFDRYLKPENQRVTNVTYMGMGEPFLNYENVLKSIRILNDKEYFNIGARSISVSTAGIVEGIKKFSEEGLQINLAISLHAPNDELRKSLMPIDKKYPLEAVLKAVDDYIEKTNRQVMFEYVLIKGVNDSDKCAEELAKLVHPHTKRGDGGVNTKEGGSRSGVGASKNLYYVNLILYNATPPNFDGQNLAGQAGNFAPSTTQRVEKFKEILKKNKVVFSQRYRFGDDIKAACGQFATNN
jgi:23S rRNA (adenine2503-C2)-methyltransferase